MMRSFLALLCLLSTWAHATTGPQQHPHIEVELITEYATWQPGSTQWIGVAMRPEHHWHTYWKNPGDSGLATQLTFTSNEPELSFGDIQWPTPERIVVSDITNFGYDGDSLLMVPVQVPLNISEQTLREGLTIQLSASWLVCKESCIPGNGEFELVMPLATASSDEQTEFTNLFATTRQVVPVNQTELALRYDLAPNDANQITFQLSAASSDASNYDLFAADETLLAASSAPVWQLGTAPDGSRWWQANLQTSEYFYQLPTSTDIVLRIDDVDGVKGIAFDAKQATLPKLTFTASSDTVSNSEHSIIVLALMAFVGGMLLNLMPCVFPVLSLKALSLVKLSGKESHQARRHGYLYATGILLSLFVLGLALSGLKQAGNAIGWGFQLQDPWFLSILTLVMVLMAASLLGAFEVAGSWMSVGSERLSKGDDTASLLSGCLAVVVASPCMTPLMAPALGVALTLPFVSMLFILMALGLGLALPILVLTFWPALISKMPKPGPWLETFKQALAFPLLLTAIWLLWLLQQHDPNIVLLLLLLLLLVAFCWWLKTRNYPRLAAIVFAASIAVPGIWYLQPGAQESRLADVATPYSPERLAQLLAANEPVFINMTADWCLTCKVNERVTFSDAQVSEAFSQHGVHYMVGDWTHRDEQISRYLDQFQHAGVPLYVLYNHEGQTQVLPQLLTPAGVIEQLDKTLAN